MVREIIGMADWLNTPAGQYLRGWEQACLRASVSDVFGFHALQLGLPEIDVLDANRMPHRWVANNQGLASGTQLALNFSALPFPEQSLDLVVMPHTLELDSDPHGVLREAARVLVPEGRVIICGFNPISLWGLAQRRSQAYQRLGFGSDFLPQGLSPLGNWRLRDWLRLLNLELDTEQSQFGCFRPALRSQAWLERFGFMDRLGGRWWPILGAAYLLVAVKRLHGMTLHSPVRAKKPRVAGAPVSVANRAQAVTDHSRKGEEPN